MNKITARKFFSYDSKTGILRWLISPSSRVKVGAEVGCVQIGRDGKSYRRFKFKGKLYLSHRVIWLIVNGEWPDKIDHQDGNGLNNAISNIRNVSVAENCKNRRLNENNKTGVTGVCLDKVTGKFRVTISKDKKQVSLGSFNDFFEAVCIRKSSELSSGYHKNHGQTRPL
jgi:hypothetical protein